MRTGALLLVLLERSAAFKAIVDTSASAWESSLIFRSQLSPSSSSSTWKNCHDTRRSVHFPRPAKSRDRSAVPLPDLSQREFPEVPDKPYDIVVLGSGPGGEAAAVQAARLGATVAVVETRRSFGGPTGLTSKAVREAAKEIIQAVNSIGGDRRRQIRKLWKMRFPALRAEAEVLQAAETRDRLAKNLVHLYVGKAEIVPFSESMVSGEVSVRVCRPTNCIDIPAHYVCVATGSRKGVVVDATEMGCLTELPNACAIIGGGVIAVEYANVLAGLGVGVSLLCKEEEFMPFLSEELRVELKQRMIRDHVLFVHNPIKRIDIGGTDEIVRVQLEKAAQQTLVYLEMPQSSVLSTECVLLMKDLPERTPRGAKLVGWPPK